MKETDNMLMPPSVVLTFLCSDHVICSVPVFVLVLLAREQGVTEQSEFLNALDIAPDHIADNKAHLSQESCVTFLQETLQWGTLAKYLACPTYLLEIIGTLWSSGASTQGPFSIRFQRVTMPNTIYRFMRFHPDRIRALIAEGKLFMPCPAMFNDPFDCSLDEPIRLTFIESAIGCFSTKPDNVLMFSHYADNHRGLCVGFDTRQLLSSLTTMNTPLRADVRPVWYLSKIPGLSLDIQPALCATCKCDIWSYEQEFRVFMAKGSSLAASGLFTFDRGAITEVICGCQATDDTVAACKSLTNDLPSCKHKKAFQIPNQFGVQLHEIHKI
ncbi:MAG: DUF2971 domain-containing protein [Deltaproteobacteria bacterium]|nr:DUF2971 domain-containing protein [Deltaproteobacteria bacterium]